MKLGVTAHALIANEAGHLLLVHEPNIAYWYTPGGRVEPGERLDVAVAREVFEETGLQSKVLGPAAVTECFDDESPLHKVEVFFWCEATERGVVAYVPGWER